MTTASTRIAASRLPVAMMPPFYTGKGDIRNGVYSPRSHPRQAGVVVDEHDRQNHAVGAIEHAAVAGNDPARVLGVVSALDHRLAEVAELREHRHEGRD